jgi:hypothetical protein
MRYLAVWMVMLLAALCIAAGGGEEPSYDDNNCVQCHQDLPGRSSEIVQLEWKKSVHFAASVGCDGCHGGDPSLKREQFPSEEQFKRAAHLQRNPEFLLMDRERQFVSAARGRSVSYLCGKCHSKIKEQHLGSPHGEFGDPTCLYCHSGGHKIEPATLAIIDMRDRTDGGRCSACHQSGTMDSVKRIKEMLAAAEEQIETSGEHYRQLEEWGYRNLELEKLHHQAGFVRSQLRQIFHSFNMREITNYVGEIQGVADRTEASFQLIQRLRYTQRHQTVMGALAVVLLLGFAGLLVHYKHRYLEQHGPAPAAGADDDAAPQQAPQQGPDAVPAPSQGPRQLDPPVAAP